MVEGASFGRPAFFGSVANEAQGAMPGQWLLSRWGGRGPRGAPCGRREALVPGLHAPLPVLAPGPAGEPHQGLWGGVKRLPPPPRPWPPRHGSLLLRHARRASLYLPAGDGRAVGRVGTWAGGCRGVTAVAGHALRAPSGARGAVRRQAMGWPG